MVSTIRHRQLGNWLHRRHKSSFGRLVPVEASVRNKFSQLKKHLCFAKGSEQ